MDATIYTADYRKRGLLPLLGGQVVLRRNSVSDFVLDVNGNHQGWERFEIGNRVVISHEGRQILAGAVDHIADDMTAGVRDITLSGSCDMQWLEQRVTYPDPARHVQEQTADAYYRATGPAATVIRNLVRLNVGEGARSERRRTLVTQASSAGGTVSVNTRYKPVLEEAHSLALVGNVTFRTWQEGYESKFGFTEQRDLTRAVRLSAQNGGLVSWSMSQTAPEVTDVIVAGQGVGNERNIILRQGNANEWGVSAEEFRDRRDTDDDNELVQAGDESLEEGREKASISLELGDSTRHRFGEYFSLGDRITVDLGGGVRVQDIVQSADITWSETGREVKLQVGPVLDEQDAPRWVKLVADLRKRLRGLETD